VNGIDLSKFALLAHAGGERVLTKTIEHGVALVESVSLPNKN
jgi:hypothetical protein